MTIKVYTEHNIHEYEQQQANREAMRVVQDTHHHITDDEIIERLRVRFKVLEDMTTAVKQGLVRALVVTGPAGVGKSHGVEGILSLQEAGDSKFRKFEIVKGKMSPLMLYSKLHEYREAGDVLVFDDCDDILQEDTSLNILKAALDSKDVRTINWNTASKFLSTNDLPTSFDYAGAVIFITNIKFENNRGKLASHLEAIESRCHYLDLTIDSVREKMLRIHQVVSDGMLDKYMFDDATHKEIITFIEVNKNHLRDLSLRMVCKIADLRCSFPETWKDIAQMTCMRHK
jgi:hypothetical protein